MDNLNIGFLVSSVLATTGLGVYVYMNNNNNIITEYLHDEDDDNPDAETGKDTENIKSAKKSINVKTKRRTNKQTGTRRKRY
jgi:hypothetical protein